MGDSRDEFNVEMKPEDQPKKAFRPWLEWRARRIDDPVVRLRYLRQAVSPEVVRPSTLRTRAGVLVGILAVIATSVLVVRARVQVAPLPAHARVQRPSAALWSEALSDVWLVEHSKDSEMYSNGLRIDLRFVTTTHPRAYHPLRAASPETEDEPEHHEPVGIVFHSTESMQAPFEAGHNRVLRQVGESILEFVRRHHAYNYVIDRFGRVYRVVREGDAAEHAGYSVWADEQWLYVNLNESFLGVSLEAKTEPGQEDSSASPAQIRSAAMLTEMLRSRYSIRAANCVTHAQVSVNPANMRVGWHTDWASSFPFEKLGLPNNYALPLAALTAYGFEADESYLKLGGQRLYEGVELAEGRIRAAAEERGLSVEQYRRTLQRAYREWQARWQHAASSAAEGE